VPPIPQQIGHLDWHKHRGLRAIAREFASKELQRLKSAGHPLSL